MNLLNVASGGLTGALAGSPLTAVAGLATAPLNPGSRGSASAVPDRDSALSGRSDTASAVNLLQQFAGSQSAATTSTDSSTEPELTVPPLPQMPAPKPAPAVPRDDHGQSNVVFSDADSDSTLVH